MGESTKERALSAVNPEENMLGLVKEQQGGWWPGVE